MDYLKLCYSELSTQSPYTIDQRSKLLLPGDLIGCILEHIEDDVKALSKEMMGGVMKGYFNAGRAIFDVYIMEEFTDPYGDVLETDFGSSPEIKDFCLAVVEDVLIFVPLFIDLCMRLNASLWTTISGDEYARIETSESLYHTGELRGRKKRGL